MSSQRSDYSELCPVPSTQGWDWHQGQAGSPRAAAPAEQHGQGLPVKAQGELKVSGCQGNRTGASLGSAGESPTSPLSSSSPSPASPGRPHPSNGTTATGLTPGTSLSLHPGGPHLPLPASSHATPGGISSGATKGSLAPALVPPPQGPNYCVIDVVADSHADVSDDDEDDDDRSVAWPVSGAVRDTPQQRQTVTRTTSDSSRLTVPTSPQLPDKYPGKPTPAQEHNQQQRQQQQQQQQSAFKRSPTTEHKPFPPAPAATAVSPSRSPGQTTCGSSPQTQARLNGSSGSNGSSATTPERGQVASATAASPDTSTSRYQAKAVMNGR